MHSSAKLKDICCSNQNYITTISINKSFKEIESKDHSFAITKNCTTYLSIQIRICETILLILGANFGKSIIRLHYLHIFNMLAKFQVDQRLITMS